MKRAIPLPMAADETCAPASAAPRLTPAAADRLAEQLRVLADPTRLRILDVLAQQPGPLCVCDITARFAVQQPTISHHLRVLRGAGLATGTKRGVWAHYQATAAGRDTLAWLVSRADAPERGEAPVVGNDTATARAATR